MKLTKSVFKSIVKECLLEILAEGLGGELNESLARRPSGRSDGAGRIAESDVFSPPPRVTERYSHQPQRPAVPRAPLATLPQKVVPVVETAIREVAGGNNALASILAETAATTLVEQNRAERSGPAVAGDLAARTVAAASPDQIFGDDVASRWASLAFDGK